MAVQWSTVGQSNLMECIPQIHNRPWLVLAYSMETVCIDFSLLIECLIIIFTKTECQTHINAVQGSQLGVVGNTIQLGYVLVQMVHNTPPMAFY